MKKILAILLACCVLFVATGCGEPRTINGKYQDTIGVVNHIDGSADPCVKYEVSMGNVIWGVILIETVVAPIYFFGWSMFNPVSAKECATK